MHLLPPLQTFAEDYTIKSYNMEETISTFRAITQDYQISESEVLKFIKYGRGDVQQALNYYYNHIQKGKIKKKTKQQSVSSLSQPTLEQLGSQAKIDDGKYEKVKSNKQYISNCQEEEYPDSNKLDAFTVIRKGSIQHEKTHAFIRKVREVYKLPIKGKPQHQLITHSNACLPEHQGIIPEEFMMVDCMSQVFNNQNLNEMLIKKNGSFIQHHQVKQVEKVYVDCSQTNSVNIDSVKNKQVKNKQYIHKQIQQYQYANNIEPLQQKDKPKIQQKQKPQWHQKQFIKNKQINKQIHLIQQNIIQQNQFIQQKQHALILSNSKIRDSLIKTQKLIITNSQHQLQQDELYLGQYFARAVWTISGKFDQSNNGSEVRVQTYMQDEKSKKKKVGRKVQRNMNMRITWDGRQIGRIADQEVRIILPLIEANLIRVQFFFHNLLPYMKLLESFKLKAIVYITNKLITEPIIQTFEPKQDDKERVEQLSALLTKVNLPILTQPLIKAKSKYIKNKKQKKDLKKQSIDIFEFERLQKKKQDIQQKNIKQLHRLRTDPNYKQKQQSLEHMKCFHQQNCKQKCEENLQDDGKVKKKVYQIDLQQTKDKFSELIELHQQNCLPYYPQNNFLSQLYPYQALALSWMLRRQGFLTNMKQKQQLHPLWTEYSIPTNHKYRLYFNELTGQLCVKRPISVLKCKGGILADEMGLGKTVMMAALIVANPVPPIHQPNQAGTLVVVPLTLLSQWEAEIAKHTSNQKTIIYYSSNRQKILASLPQYEIVISTYGTISHEFAQGYHTKKLGIYQYKWYRVILDEAHYIKGRIIQTSKSVYQLQSTSRWCLTGTPIQNHITDIFSQLHFIKYTPWSQFACWTRFITKPLEEGDQSIYQILRTILKQVFLRRTKSTKSSDGKPIIELPTKTSKVQLLTMSNKQRQYYDSIYRSSRSSFDELIEKGILEAKYMQVLQMLMRLRQICCHPILFKSVAKFTKNQKEFENQLNKLIEKSSQGRKQNQIQVEEQYYQPIIDIDREQIRVKANSITISKQYLKDVLQRIANQNLQNCIICLNQPQDPVITCCLHIFCKACNIRQVEQKGSCAYCRKPLAKQDFIHLPRESRLNLTKVDVNKQSLFPSTKMIALKQHLDNLASRDKAVVFSQFLGMLDLLQNQFINHSIKYLRMEGAHNHKERTKIVKQFQQNPQVKVFLVSLKTAGVGLNLTAANKVFLMDPWWNPAVEEQAIERVHRIGQQRQVEVYRFIMDRTIETRMLDLNTEKKLLSQNVLKQQQEKDSGNVSYKMEKLKYLMQNY